jgi:hypothetical protein
LLKANPASGRCVVGRSLGLLAFCLHDLAGDLLAAGTGSAVAAVGSADGAVLLLGSVAVVPVCLVKGIWISSDFVSLVRALGMLALPEVKRKFGAAHLALPVVEGFLVEFLWRERVAAPCWPRSGP